MRIKWDHNPVSIYHYTVTIALVSEPPINLVNVRGLYK